MLTRLLFLCLFGHVLGKKPPDVDCVVLNLQSVSCYWNQQGTPEVNYTFFSSFDDNPPKHECPAYLTENNTTIGCNQPCNATDRFQQLYTLLVHGKESIPKDLPLRSKVKLNSPINLTVLNGSDFNLWFYWNHTVKVSDCVESEVRYRINDKAWKFPPVGSPGKQSYCINLPSCDKNYELQVRSRVASICGQSAIWSDWSEPVVWGSKNCTVSNKMDQSMSVWKVVGFLVGAATLILLVMLLLYHERVRVLIIPVVPKPSPIPQDIEDWFQLPKGLKEGFKANYNETACPVREYCQVSLSDNDSSDSSSSSVNTDQTDCSASTPLNKPDYLSTSFSSSASTMTCEEKELQDPV